MTTASPQALASIIDRLQDDESRGIFKVLSGFRDDFEKPDVWNNFMRELFWTVGWIRRSLKKKIYILGTEKSTWHWLFPNLLYQAYVEEDSHPLVGKTFNGLPVIPATRLRRILGRRDGQTVAVFGNYAEYLGQFDKWTKLGISGDDILAWDKTTPYFDRFEPDGYEVLIDGGAFDGKTAEDFFKWCKDGKCYCFEPMDVPRRQLPDKPVEFVKKCLWSCSGAQLKFCEMLDPYLRSGSHVERNGNNSYAHSTYVRESVAIDDYFKGKERVTYFKLDVEGSEKEALLGAEKTLKRDKPKLAISLYHKPEDWFELPDLILKFVPEYKMWIRHYAVMYTETVLYCQT